MLTTSYIVAYIGHVVLECRLIVLLPEYQNKRVRVRLLVARRTHTS